MTTRAETTEAALPRQALAIGLVLAVTAFAFDNLAITTAMPTITRALGGVQLYGAAFSAFSLAMLFSLAVSGPLADRLGPRPVLATGLTLFTAGLLLGGSAPSMPVVVAGRAVQGVGAGTIGTCAYVVIARVWSDDERPRMFAMLSAAWIVPGLVAPGIAGVVSEQLTWRLVFFGLVPFPILAAILALPVLGHLGPVAATPDGGGLALRRRAVEAVGLAIGVGLLLAALQAHGWLLGVSLGVAGAAIAVPSLRRIVPPGTFRARPVLPALVAFRSMLNWAFFGADAFIPFMLATVRHHGSAFAGIVLTVSSCAWAAAAWLQARPNGLSTRATLRTGLVLLVAGTAAVMCVSAFRSVPVEVVFAAWALGGAGMGVAFNATSVAAMAGAGAGQEGETGSALQLADALGAALATGLGGTVVAVAARSGWRPSSTVLVVFGITVAAVVPAWLATRRLASGAA